MNEKKTILIMFGGQSAEHEVSIITGLQVLENIDRSFYNPLVLYISKQGELLLLENLQSRKEFFTAKRIPVVCGVKNKKGFISIDRVFGKKYYPYAAYLAFHGGKGESGSVQGMLDMFSIPYTSSNVESSSIAMNKQLTKDILTSQNISIVKGICYDSESIKNGIKKCVEEIQQTLHFPVIIKPAHLGSSIGIIVAKTFIELELGLLEASHIDTEIVVEQFLSNIYELNCSVRYVNNTVETSEIERPITKENILNFDEKYKKGGKKTSGAGMASLSRELPAKISIEMKEEVINLAKKAFTACGCKGVVRIDFIVSETGEIFLNEINPIPGSMAFYLWETSGISFKQQITDLIEQSVVEHEKEELRSFEYNTDIVKTFIAG